MSFLESVLSINVCFLRDGYLSWGKYLRGLCFKKISKMLDKLSRLFFAVAKPIFVEVINFLFYHGIKIL